MPDTPCQSCDARGWNIRDNRVEPCDCGTFDPPRWVERGDAPCLIPHYRDPDRPRRAHVGHVCAGHRDRLEQMLAELPSLHAELGLALTSSEKPGEKSWSKNGQVSGGVTLNKFVVDARDEVYAEVVRFVLWVVDEREVSPPGHWDVGPRPVGFIGPQNAAWQRAATLTDLATWLLTHVDWMCAEPNIDDEYANLSRLTRDCRRRAYPQARHRVEIGPCGDGDCPGRLWLSADPDGNEGRGMACDDCGRAVEPRYWRRERKRIDGVDVNPWLTLAEAAVQYGTTTRTVERWVKAGKLKARGAPMRVKSSAVEAMMRSLTDRCA